MNRSKKYFFNAGRALWKNRYEVSQKRFRLEKLAKVIGWLSDSSLPQYAQLLAITLEFKPSIIIDLGRGYGNSTAVFTEAANSLIQTRKVLSICLSDNWQKEISQKIAREVEPTWFDKLDARIINIFDVDVKQFIKREDKVLLFWDAHGWEVSEYVLGDILPKLQKNKHLILVHDILDVRYHQHLKDYQGRGIWKEYQGDEEEHKRIILNSMASCFEEIIPLNDFLERNNLLIHSVEDEIYKYIINKKNKKQEITNYLGKELSSSVSSIFWFSLNEHEGTKNISFPIVKPNVVKPSKPKVEAIKQLSVKPLISIITPCFNSKKYIGECIESILGQDYPYIEHVIQDGGSTDGTLEIIKEYARKYRKIIKWKSEKDRGQSDGLNKALRRAKGEIILVLNADDALMPYACSWGVSGLTMYPKVAVIYGDEYIINESSKIIHFFTGPEPYDFAKIFCVEQVIPAQAAFIRRSALEKVGFYADTSLATCPDYEMWVRIGLKFPMKHVYGPIAKYRWHSQSEGQKPEMINKMIMAKRTVMRKVFTDKTTPQTIIRLKKRAYANVDEWASQVSAQLGDRKKTYLLLLRSTLAYPQLHKIIRLIHISLKNLRILINKIISSY